MRIARLLLVFNVLLVMFPNIFRSVDCRSRSKNSERPPLTKEEREKDFSDWLLRVGLKSHPNDKLPSVTLSSVPVPTSGNVITVGKKGTADFTTVQAAVNSVPNKNTQRVVIQIAAGVYKEKVNIPSSKPFITFQGAGSSVTSITWDDTASSSGSTFKSASVAVNSDYFIAKGISFTNTAPAPPPGAEGKQAVALRISGDKAQFFNCAFYGAQDTLYDAQGRHYFKDCFIQGSIDFIFGDGQSYYEGCQLHAIAKTSGSLTAQKRSSPGETTGFSFVNCTVTGSGTLYLGRAWGTYSRVVFLYTYIADIIIPAGWFDWGVSSREKTAFYGQYKCSGPGADVTGRAHWSHVLTDAQAVAFLSLDFIDGSEWVQK